MLIFNQELGEKDCDFNPDVETKNFLVSFFGFYSHHIADDFEKFLGELGIKKVINDTSSSFKLNGKYALEAYDCTDRRTFDTTIIVPKTFTNKKEALEWFNQKVKDSHYMKLSEISEIDVIDGDKLFPYLSKESEYEAKVKEIDDVFKKKIQKLKAKMLEDFNHDSDYESIIEQRFNRPI